MTDLWQSPPTTYAGDATRDKPVLDRAELGPWRARVRITPLVGVSGAERAIWEVSAQWEAGPPLLAFQEHWGPGDPRHAVTDQALTTELELAEEVARRAIDMLRNGIRFDLQTLARETRERR
jgi:hypothetical protein